MGATSLSGGRNQQDNGVAINTRGRGQVKSIMPSSEHNFIPYGHQWLDEEDIAAAVEVLRSDWITQGPKVDEFEKTMAERCGAKYAVAVANGTAALHAACIVAGIGDGDEVISTPITFAPARAIILV